MNSGQFRKLIVRPTLQFLDPEIPYSRVAEELLMLTAATESHLGEYIAQVGGGPALGVYQMEPATHEDLLNSLKMPAWNKIAIKVYLFLPMLLAKEHLNQLVGNLYYATTMARLKYYAVKEALPPPHGDILGLAMYWKLYYNTYAGKGKADEALENYRRYVQ